MDVWLQRPRYHTKQYIRWFSPVFITLNVWTLLYWFVRWWSDQIRSSLSIELRLVTDTDRRTRRHRVLASRAYSTRTNIASLGWKNHSPVAVLFLFAGWRNCLQLYRESRPTEVPEIVLLIKNCLTYKTLWHLELCSFVWLFVFWPYMRISSWNLNTANL